MPVPTDYVDIVPASEQDRNLLADLRVAAMRPSLEAVGRFDPERARTRFLSNFSSAATSKLLVDGKLAGFFVVYEESDHHYLDHLYIHPIFQGKGMGQLALNGIKKRAADRRLPIRLIALNGSPANDFYKRNGFRPTGSDALDTSYEWAPADK